METREHKIVVGYDGSEDAELALAWATRLAAGRSATVHVVNALPAPPWELAYTTEDQRRQRAAAAALLTDAVERLATDGVAVTSEIARPPAAAALVAAAEDGAMVVVGSRGHGRLAELMVGSVSQHTARHANGPVVVVRQQLDPGARRVVLGLDWSSDCDAAIGFAFDMAASTDSPLWAIHAFTKEDAPYARSPYQRDRSIAEQTAAQERLIAEATHPWQEKFPEVQLVTEAVPLPARTVLRDASEHSALLVVGARGSGALSRLGLGSVAESMLHHARCPVALVH